MTETKSVEAVKARRRRDHHGVGADIQPVNGPRSNGEAGESERREDDIRATELRAFSLASRRGWENRIRRGCDILVSALALIALAPVLLLIAVAIKLDSNGPVLYRQLRVGIDRRRNRGEEETGRRTKDLGGRPFVMYKFRTMSTDAERESGPVWAKSEDDRVTRVGRFLRRHRLDELPQFWNVLTGDMSVVGPRPERPCLVSELRRKIHSYQVRHRVRPGITGWAQINQDSDQTVDDVRSKLRYDIEYLERRSLGFDFHIMARTLPVMVERDALDSGDEDQVSDHEPERREVSTTVGT